MKPYSIVAIAVFACLPFFTAAVSEAAEPFKAFQLSDESGTTILISFHAKPGSSDGIVVICSKSQIGEWRITNGVTVWSPQRMARN